MRDKKIFSWKLCREGIRQVKLIGILTLVIVLVASVSTIVGEYLDAAYYVEHCRDVVEAASLYKRSISLYRENPYVLFTIASAFIMVVSLFGFMNKRNECDFYHSLPHTRLCVFLSFMASVLIWNIAIIAAGLLASVIMLGVLPYVELNTAYLGQFALNAVVAVMLVSGTCAFAMTLTGTTLSNVIAAVIFLFVPKACMLVYTAMLSEALPFVPIATNNFWLDVDNNVIWGLLAALVGEGAGFLTEWTTFLYSLLLSLFYMAMAALMFIKRKSEAATKASINAGLQYVFRLIPAFLISLISIYGILSMYISGEAWSDEDIFALILVYIFAVIAYFLYEAITTRRLKNLVKAIPGLIGLVALNLVFIGALIGTYNHELSFKPEADEVDYVYIMDDEDSYRPNYFRTATEKVKLSSDEVKAVLTDCLKDTVDKWENTRYGENSFYNYYYKDSTIWVTFVCDGKKVDRRVIVNNTNYERLKSALAAEEGYVEAFKNAMLKDADITFYDLADSYEQLVTETFREELSTKAFGELYDLIYGSDNSSYRNRFYIYAYFSSKTPEIVSDKTTVDVTFDFPRTVAAYLNCINKQNSKNPVAFYIKDVNELNKVAAGEGVEYQDLSLSIELNTIKNGVVSQTEYYSIYSYYDGYSGYSQTGEKLEKIEQLASLMDNNYEFTEADFDGEVRIARVNYYVYKEGSYVSYAVDSDYYDESVCVSVASESCEGYFMVDEEMYNLLIEIESMGDTDY